MQTNTQPPVIPGTVSAQEEKPGQGNRIILPGVANYEKPQSPPRARGNALRAAVGVPGFSVPTEKIAIQLEAGMEKTVRMQMVDERFREKYNAMEETLDRSLAVAAEKGENMSPLDRMALEGALQARAEPLRFLDPEETVIEKGFAEQLTNAHNIKSQTAAMDEDGIIAAFNMEFFENTAGARAVNADLFAGLAERWKESSTGSKAADVGASMLPWYWQGVWQYNAAEGTRDVRPGQLLENQFDYWSLRAQEVPLDQYKEELRQQLDSMYAASPLEALHLADMLNKFNTADKAMMNSMGLLDVFGSLVGGVAGKVAIGGAILTGSVAARAAKRGPSSLLAMAQKIRTGSQVQADATKAQADLLRAASGAIPDTDAIRAAGGNAHEVAREQGVAEYLNGFTGTPTGQAILDDLDVADKVPSLMNIPKLTGRKLTPDLVELANKTRNAAEQRAAHLLEGLTDQLKSPRVDSSQVLKGIESMADDINRDLPNLQESVLGVHDVPLRVDDPINVVRMEAVIGKKNGEFFPDRVSAASAMKRMFNNGKNTDFDMEVAQYGDGQYYISVMRDMDESAADVRNMEIPLANSTPRSRWDWLRSATALQNRENYDQSLIASYGISGNLQARLATTQKALRAAKLDPRSSVKEVSRFMDYQRDSVSPYKGTDAEPGWWSPAPDDFIIDFKQFTGRYPTKNEANLYFTYKDVRSFDLILQNLAEVTSKRAVGIRQYSFRMPGAGMEYAPGVEGKLIRDPMNEIPWANNKSSTRVAFLDGGDVHIKKSKGKTQEFMEEKKGEWKFIQLNTEGRVTLLEDTMWGSKIDGHVDYVAVRDFESKHINFNQIPERDGPPRSFGNVYYTSQPQLEVVRDNAGNVTRVMYKGSTNLMQHAVEKEGKAFGAAFNRARELYKKANKAQSGTPERASALRDLKAMITEEFPWWSTKEFIAQMKKKFDPDSPVFVRKTNSDLNDTAQVQRWVKKTYGENVEFMDVIRDPNNLDNLVNRGRRQKREPAGQRVANVGSEAKPVFSLEKPIAIDPMTTIARQVHQSVKGRYFDDLKMQYANQFIREFGDLIEAPADAIRMDPVGTLLTASVKDSGDWTKVKAAKAFQRHAQRFAGIQNKAQTRAEAWIDGMAQKAYERLGVKGLEGVHNSKVLASITDPVQLLRTMAFHSSMGFFNPVQLFVQSQTHTNIAALEGMGAATMGMNAAWVQGALIRNWQKGMHDKVMKRIANNIGWKPEHLKESWEGLRASGFWNVGTEMVERDSLSPTLSSAGFLDSGLYFFSKAEAFTRRTAWNAAYYKWRKANPTAKFDNNAMIQVLSRADFTTNTMGRNAKAAWNSGWPAVPTQFWNWNARMLDNFLGTRMTAKERARLVATHSVLYGIPVGLGAAGVGQVLPFQEMVRDQLIKSGTDYSEDILQQMAYGGLLSTVMTGITGEEWNIGERYGTGALPFVSALYNYFGRGSEDPYDMFMETLGGAPGNFVTRTIGSIDPAGALLHSLTDVNNPNYMAQSWSEFERLMGQYFSSAEGFRKARMALRYKEITSRNGRPEEQDLSDALVKAFTGLSPQQKSDDFRARDINFGLEKEKQKIINEGVRLNEAGMREMRVGNYVAADEYFKQAKTYVMTSAPDDETAREWFKLMQEKQRSTVLDTWESLGEKGFHEAEVMRKRNEYGQ